VSPSTPSGPNPADGGAARAPRPLPPGPAPEPVPPEHLQLLFESAVDYAIFSVNPDRTVNTWNTGAQRIFGFHADEILGLTADVLFTPEDRAKGAPQQEATTAAAEGRAMDERWHMRKDGTRFFASGVMTPLHRDGRLVGFVKIARDLTERKRAEDRLWAAQRELELRVSERTEQLRATNAALQTEILQRREAQAGREELLRRIATAQEDERRRISRELHDEIGQHLAALMLGLNALEPDLAGSASAAVLPKLQQLTETIGREVHALAAQLRPAVLDDLGLVRAIATYVDLWSGRSGVKVELHAADLESHRLTAELELALYRIVQEALTNVMKHAEASRVSLILNRRGRDVVAIIEDNGRGFEPEAQKQSPIRGLGLLGMRERAAQLRGQVTVESQPGHGTTVFVRLPTHPA
jgi:PAS domain S-box-containing protein